MRGVIRFLGASGLLAFAVSTLPSCSLTYHEMIAPARDAFFAGDLNQADQFLAEKIDDTDEDDSERGFFLLERSILELASGKAQEAEQTLLEVRDRFDTIDQEKFEALSSDFASYFTDDRFKAHSGEDYEKVMIRVLLTVANLMQDGDDAVAYANQIMEKQRQIMDEEIRLPDGTVERFKMDYKHVGAGDYFYGLITENDPTAGSEALISYRKVRDNEPQFTLVNDDIQRVESRTRIAPDHGALYVIAMVGRGPEKFGVEERDLTLASEVALQFTRFISVIGENFGPTLDLSPLRIPQVQARENDIDGVQVSVGADVLGSTGTLTDVSEMAVRQFAANKKLVVAKAIVRRMTKKAITTAAKGAAKIAVRSSGAPAWAQVLVEIGGIISNTVWSATERADTRHWAFLPDSVQIFRAELPQGEHEITLTPQLSGVAEGFQRSVRVQILAGESSYVLGFLPTRGIGPLPVTSRPSQVEVVTLP